MTDNKQLEKTNNIDQIEEVLGHLAKKDKRMIVAFAPSVRVSIGEMFGGEVGKMLRERL